MKTELDKAAPGAFFLAALAGHAVLEGIGGIACRTAHLGRRTYLAPFILGNTGKLGLPLPMFAFGEAGLGYAVVMLAVSATLSSTYGIYLAAGRNAGSKAIRELMVWTTLPGGLFLWQELGTPRFLTNALE
ncbi:hypothetical protein [Leisingera sp. M658]|uniref:hypothetical protein n=1 Tax=Leisingera sp. M658 TaxID=2867015 RepID=UPI0038FC8F90